MTPPFPHSVVGEKSYLSVSTFTGGDRLPPQWTQYVHPQGWVYFRHDALKVVTDEDIREPHIHVKLSKYCESITEATQQDREIYVLGPTSPPFVLYVDHFQCTAAFDYKSTVSGIHHRTLVVFSPPICALLVDSLHSSSQ